MNIKRKDGTIFLSGVINEDSDFTALLNEPDQLKLNFAGVQRVNSIGVRSWMKFLSQWGDQRPIEYHECSTVVADQLCIISSLRGVRNKIATVKSAFLPIECLKCGKEGELRVTSEDFQQDNTLQKKLGKCSKCSNQLSFSIADVATLFSN